MMFQIIKLWKFIRPTFSMKTPGTHGSGGTNALLKKRLVVLLRCTKQLRRTCRRQSFEALAKYDATMLPEMQRKRNRRCIYGFQKKSNKQCISPGFSVLELMMVMAVSAIIMTSLFEIYNQVMNNSSRVERCVIQDAQILTLENRLNKDLLGISAVWFTQADLEKKRAAKDASDAPATKNQTQQQDNKKSNRYFYSINQQGNLDVMTFVTTSALQSYGVTQDRFVRVVYKLEKDVQHAGTFRLMRKEISTVSEYIDDQSLKLGKFYELANNITSLETTFHFIDVQELKKQQKAQSQDDITQAQQESKETKQLIRSVKEWKEEKKKKKEKQQNDSDDQEDDLGGAVVPKIVDMVITFGMQEDSKPREYKLSWYLLSNIDNVVQLPVKKQPVAPTAVPAEK